MRRCDPLMHCWHVKSSSTDGLGKKGYDTVFCCFCGVVKRRNDVLWATQAKTLRTKKL